MKYVITLAFLAGCHLLMAQVNNISQVGNGNYAVITQIGPLNTSDIVVEGDFNGTLVYQEGDNNGSNIEITPLFFYPTHNRVEVTQIGDHLHNVDVYVTGIGNLAVVHQQGSGGEELYTNIYQGGLFGSVWVTQLSQESTVFVIQGDFSGFNTATIFQDGEALGATVLQTGWFNAASITQEGFEVGSSIEQNGFLGIAISEQAGNWLSSSILQNASAPLLPDFAWVTQEGEGHLSMIKQHGVSGGNYARVIQFGLDKFSDIDQVGSFNSITVIQP